MVEARPRPAMRCQNYAQKLVTRPTAQLAHDTDEMAGPTRHRCLLTSSRVTEDNRPMVDRGAIERAFQQMLEAVKTSNPRFVFDREGRPGAIAAIRGALPMVERDLFDAVMEDCECELAATREAMFQMLTKS